MKLEGIGRQGEADEYVSFEEADPSLRLRYAESRPGVFILYVEVQIGYHSVFIQS